MSIESLIEGGLEEKFPYLLQQSALLLRRNLESLMDAESHPINLEAFKVLVVLWHEDGLSQNRLCELGSSEKHTITRVVNKLEKESLVVRVPDQLDGRSKLVFLTHQGKALFEPTKAIAIKNLTKGLKGVNREELEVCRRVLKQIVSNLS